MGSQSEWQPFTGEIEEALQNNNHSLAAKKIQDLLDKEDNIHLNIAITGESGSGKSTFINAFRGKGNGDEGAAPTGCVETTIEVTPYPHPNCPNVTFFDLPGVGTTKFKASKYLKQVEFKKFDFFIIISDTRFTENDAKLAQEIQKMKKRFYFVRSKIDNDLRSERSQSNFSEETTLNKIRESYIKGLKEQGIEAPQVFLVSSSEVHLYDFSVLHETLERELPEHKRNALLMVTPITNLEIISKKKKAFQAKIKYFALLSAGVAGVPVPGLSIAVDLALLVGVVTKYVFGFGLDIPTLRRLAEITGVPFKDLMNVIVSPLAATTVTSDLMVKVLSSFSGTAVLLTAEEVSRLIPIIGIPVSMGLSCVSTYRILNEILNMLAVDAENVLRRVLEKKE